MTFLKGTLSSEKIYGTLLCFPVGCTPLGYKDCLLGHFWPVNYSLQHKCLNVESKTTHCILFELLILELFPNGLCGTEQLGSVFLLTTTAVGWSQRLSIQNKNDVCQWDSWLCLPLIGRMETRITEQEVFSPRVVWSQAWACQKVNLVYKAW